MICDRCGAPLVEQEVTYLLEMNGTVVVVEHVPARVCPQCGERLFAPATVERLQQVVWEEKEPLRLMRAPVFDFVLSG